jgi:hypothetical protein
MKERRKHPRITQILPVKLCNFGFDIITETKNISATGTYCAVDRPIEPMTKLDMVLLVPFKKNRSKSIKKINCQGVVVRKDYVKDNGRHSYYVGIYFNEIKESDRKLLASYINSILSLSNSVEPAQEL